MPVDKSVSYIEFGWCFSAAEQRSDSRISAHGFDCRNKGFQHLVHGEDKPVGLAVDSASQTLFWSNDADSPHGLVVARSN